MEREIGGVRGIWRISPGTNFVFVSLSGIGLLLPVLVYHAVKYDLDLTTQIPLVFKRFKGNILGLESFGRPVYIKNARRISPTDLFDIIATLSK